MTFLKEKNDVIEIASSRDQLLVNTFYMLAGMNVQNHAI